MSISQQSVQRLSWTKNSMFIRVGRVCLVCQCMSFWRQPTLSGWTKAEKNICNFKQHLFFHEIHPVLTFNCKHQNAIGYLSIVVIVVVYLSRKDLVLDAMVLWVKVLSNLWFKTCIDNKGFSGENLKYVSRPSELNQNQKSMIATNTLSYTF